MLVLLRRARVFISQLTDESYMTEIRQSPGKLDTDRSWACGMRWNIKSNPDLDYQAIDQLAKLGVTNDSTVESQSL
jgi:hypothetical protein